VGRAEFNYEAGVLKLFESVSTERVMQLMWKRSLTSIHDHVICRAWIRENQRVVEDYWVLGPQVNAKTRERLEQLLALPRMFAVNTGLYFSKLELKNVRMHTPVYF
jgi:hypothetical protein